MAELRLRVSNLIETRKRLRTRYEGDGALPRQIPAETADAPLTDEESFVQRVREAVEAALGDETFTVESLADAVGMSRSHLARQLKDLTGQTPSETIREMRLDRAAEMLTARVGSVSEVAYAVGFKSVAHFSNGFVKHTGHRPSVYAEAQGAA